MVWELTKIYRHLLFIESACGIVDIEFDFVKQERTLRHMSATAATGEERQDRDCQKNYDMSERNQPLSFLFNEATANLDKNRGISTSAR